METWSLSTDDHYRDGGRYDSSRASKMHRTTTTIKSTSSPRLTGRLLRMFLLLNIMAVVVFIFASIWYFPSTSPSGIVEQAIKQGDVTLLEIPKRAEVDSSHGNATFAHERVDERPGSDAFVTAKESRRELPNLSMDDSEPDKKPNLRGDTKPSTGTNQKSTTAQVAGYTLTASVVQRTHPPARNTTASVTRRPSPISGLQSQNIQEALRRMKAVTIPTTESASRQSSIAPKPFSSQQNPLPRDRDEEPESPIPSSLNGEGMHEDLVVWLSSNEGVEVENIEECEVLGTACEVKSWKSKTVHQHVPVEFRPVEPRMRPVLVPRSRNGHSTVSLSCGFVDVSGFNLHESMTLFFVLVPSGIEVGDTYRGQKFFGSSPYGQFLLHGGKPAFFTDGGLVEGMFSFGNGEFLLVTYRLQRHTVEIKANGLDWGSRGNETNPLVVRLSGNDNLSLGNVKPICDTNAFQGRVAEVLIYKNVLSNTKVTTIERYLLDKWWGDRSPIEPPAGLPSRSRGFDEYSGGRTSNSAVQVVESSRTTIVNERTEETTIPQELSTTLHTRPRAFDPEGIFVWEPSPDILAAVSREQGTEATLLLDQWKRAVSEKVASIRNFQLGGDILRAFIRERRDELVTMRDHLFG